MRFLMKLSSLPVIMFEPEGIHMNREYSLKIFQVVLEIQAFFMLQSEFVDFIFCQSALYLKIGS